MWEPLQKQFLALSLKTSAALLYAGEGRLFILRSLSIFKKENVLKSFDFRTFAFLKGRKCAVFTHLLPFFRKKAFKNIKRYFISLTTD